MISREEAAAILERHPVPRPAAETVGLSSALGRILARDVFAPMAIPAFDRSAMDGFALPAGESSDRFAVVMTLAAGDIPARRLEGGECARIMTGAMLPGNSDRVVRREYVEDLGDRIRLVRSEEAGNVMRAGEDLQPGSLAIPAGTRLRPAGIGLLASLGLDRLEVTRPPLVGVITTGGELVEPGRPLPPGRIFNANAFTLGAQLSACGMPVRLRGPVPDDPPSLAAAVESLSEECDTVVLSGGVSAGDWDHVPAVLRRLGVELAFVKVAVQPGMPTVFGFRQGKYYFGLPGNPVSTLVIFDVFVKPFLFRLAGCRWQPEMVTGTMAEAFRRRRAERTAFVPVRRDGRRVFPLAYHGSGHLLALSLADGLLEVGAGRTEIPAGEMVDVRSL